MWKKKVSIAMSYLGTNYHCVSKSQTERMVTMQTQDFFWRFFQQTGGIGAYLIYKQMMEEEESRLVQIVSEGE